MFKNRERSTLLYSMKVVKSLMVILYLGKGLAAACSSSVTGDVPTAINTATVSFAGKFSITPNAFKVIRHRTVEKWNEQIQEMH